MGRQMARVALNLQAEPFSPRKRFYAMQIGVVLDGARMQRWEAVLKYARSLAYIASGRLTDNGQENAAHNLQLFLNEFISSYHPEREGLQPEDLDTVAAKGRKTWEERFGSLNDPAVQQQLEQFATAMMQMCEAPATEAGRALQEAATARMRRS